MPIDNRYLIMEPEPDIKASKRIIDKSFIVDYSRMLGDGTYSKVYHAHHKNNP